MIKYLLLTLLLALANFGQAQTVIDTMSVFPNPFDSLAIIHFEIANNDTVTLEVLNPLGQTVRTFFLNIILPSGSYSIYFHGDTLPAGIYFVRLKYAFDKNIVKKVVRQVITSASIHDPTKDKRKFIFYPNPTYDLLTIPIDGEKNIIITNLQGEICKRLTTYDKTISLSDLLAGNYVVSVFNQEKSLLTTTQIIKAK